MYWGLRNWVKQYGEAFGIKVVCIEMKGSKTDGVLTPPRPITSLLPAVAHIPRLTIAYALESRKRTMGRCSSTFVY